MNKPALPLKVRILEKEYRIACGDGEAEEDLMAAAKLLNDRMHEIRDVGKVIGVERIAVVAALNMANDFLNKTNKKEDANSVNARVKALHEKIDVALNESNQLEL